MSAASPPPPPAPPPPLANLDDYEAHARTQLAPAIFGYYAGAANSESTLRRNRSSYQELLIRPRYLVDVSHVSTATHILHHPLSSPILLAPVALQCMAHPDGEAASARAAAAFGGLMMLSTTSTTSIEDVRAAAPTAAMFFQLYVYNDRSITTGLVQRAEAAAYTALVVTVDTPYIGLKERDVRSDFSIPARFSAANFSGELRRMRRRPVGVRPAVSSDKMGRASHFTWADLAWLRSITRLPVLVKGVLTAADAVEACRGGCAGLVVSNHGGRQLDGVPATSEVLPGIVEAVRGWETGEGRGIGQRRVAVVADGGVRRGTDVFKLLVLGADAVMIGRPMIWGLTYAGEAGVRQVLDLLTAELRLCMALAGCPTLASIDRTRVTTREAMRPKL